MSLGSGTSQRPSRVGCLYRQIERNDTLSLEVSILLSVKVSGEECRMLILLLLIADVVVDLLKDFCIGMEVYLR